MAGPWHSERLIFRAVEPEDEPFLGELSSDPEAFMNAAPFLPIPRSKQHSKEFRDFLNTMLVAAVVCLPPPADDASTVPNGVGDTAKQPIPIGMVNLMPIEPRQIHHRKTEIGINLVRKYQGQGYGTEAIKWALNFGFMYVGLHRIAICAFGYNTGAIKLYERMGFVLEGREREALWKEGKFHDFVRLAMLEDEWRERYGKDE